MRGIYSGVVSAICLLGLTPAALADCTAGSTPGRLVCQAQDLTGISRHGDDLADGARNGMRRMDDTTGAYVNAQQSLQAVSTPTVGRSPLEAFADPNQATRAYNGFPIAGSADGMRRQGYDVQPIAGKSEDMAYTYKYGDTTLLNMSHSQKGYRSAADEMGINIQGKDVDHAAAKKLNPDALPTTLSASDININRSHGAKEKYQEAANVADGVIYASPANARKLNGFGPEDLSKTQGRTDAFNGVSPHPIDNMSDTAAVAARQ